MGKYRYRSYLNLARKIERLLKQDRPAGINDTPGGIANALLACFVDFDKNLNLALLTRFKVVEAGGHTVFVKWAAKHSLINYAPPVSLGGGKWIPATYDVGPALAKYYNLEIAHGTKPIALVEDISKLRNEVKELRDDSTIAQRLTEAYIALTEPPVTNAKIAALRERLLAQARLEKLFDSEPVPEKPKPGK